MDKFRGLILWIFFIWIFFHEIIQMSDLLKSFIFRTRIFVCIFYMEIQRSDLFVCVLFFYSELLVLFFMIFFSKAWFFLSIYFELGFFSVFLMWKFRGLIFYRFYLVLGFFFHEKIQKIWFLCGTFLFPLGFLWQNTEDLISFLFFFFSSKKIRKLWVLFEK
jgi:hypothetical protein